MATLIQFDGVGLANDTVLGSSSAGVGDTEVTDTGGSESGTVPVRAITDDETFSNAFEIGPVGGSNTSYVRWNFTNTRSIGMRMYVKKLTANAQTNYQFQSIVSNGTGPVERLSFSGLGDPNRLRMYRGGNSTYDTTPSQSNVANTWYRIELYLQPNPNGDGNYTDGSFRYLVYEGNSTTALTDISENNVDIGDVASEFRIGSIAPAPASADTLRFAHIMLTDDAETLIGPWGDSTPAATNSFVKTSSGLSAVSARYVKTSSGLKSVLDVTRKN